MINPSRLRFLVLGCALFALAAQSAWAHPRAGMQAPQAAFSSGGHGQSLAHYRRQKVLLWLFSTWCPSCKAGLAQLARERKVLAADHVHLIVLENYRNGGYAGPSMQSTLNRYAPSVKNMPNWTVGQVTAKMAAIYNPDSYPDIYYLINPEGTIQAVGSAPSAHMGEILRFARRSGAASGTPPMEELP